MKTVLRSSLIAATFCLGIAGCDSQEEKTRNAALEGKADKKSADEASKSVKKSGENAEEALENKTKETRDPK